jgi:hypothetical protein
MLNRNRSDPRPERNQSGLGPRVLYLQTLGHEFPRTAHVTSRKGLYGFALCTTCLRLCQQT